MKKTVLLVNPTPEFEEGFTKSCQNRGIICKTIQADKLLLIATTNNCSVFYEGEELILKEIDYCFIQKRGKANHITTLLAYLLEQNKIPFNDKINLQHTLTSGKITQMVKFSQNNLPIPKSVICGVLSFETNLSIIKENISFPCVLKTKGTHGNSVWKIETQEELEEKVKEIKEQLFLIQDFIPNSSDVRSVFFEKELIGSIQRSSTDGFYNNISRGGIAEPLDITEEEIELCKKASDVAELDIPGVDFVRTANGPLFFEINKGPQLIPLKDATSLDVHDILVSKIENKYLK